MAYLGSCSAARFYHPKYVEGAKEGATLRDLKFAPRPPGDGHPVAS